MNTCAPWPIRVFQTAGTHSSAMQAQQPSDRAALFASSISRKNAAALFLLRDQVAGLLRLQAVLGEASGRS